ncbi:cobalamin-binding protein [Scleromatobacter humisilvae]|uniref:Cobalamin-binding protein n=1 Tax=Scleromatobacter humisilvae TaxID=2897159 RepID=A0A9X2BYS6_9BURK|nr:cobalamin-binding protein [Scleromatobacter humisilvae]MCK9685923.1 cobalamin-binding protein [Scleromatobacter humisilvae]
MSLRPLVLAAALLVAAATASADQAVLRIVDDAGHEVVLSHPARRIVALAPHLTELVYAAGAGEQLVAVGKFSDFPLEARSKPVISDAFAVNYEALAQLRPDLVLVWGSGTAERTKAKLRSLGVPVYEIEIRSVAGLADTLRSIGRLAGTDGVAQARAQAISNDWAALQSAYAGRRPVRVFYQLWDAPLMTLSNQHLIASAISACGGSNVFGELSTLTATVSWEVAVQRDPELVLTGGAPGEAAKPGRWAEFAQVSATKHGEFASIEGDLIARSGPRFVDGARELCMAVDRARQGLPPVVFPAAKAASATR